MIVAIFDNKGQRLEIAWLSRFPDGKYHLDTQAGLPNVYLGESCQGHFDDLPYFLQDLWPQGYLGSRMAKAHVMNDGRFSSDTRNWGAEMLLDYLAAQENLPGHFDLKGDQAPDASRQTKASEKGYPDLADLVDQGEIVGSYLGGEQPKFAIFNQDIQEHVIVKFTPKGKGPLVQRWRDILVSEHVANEALRAVGVAAAETSLLEEGGRLFLESRRFDRVGEKGRRAMLSLESVDAEFTGLGSGWVAVMEALCQRQLVSDVALETTKLLWCFGEKINNTDRHLGNISLTVENKGFSLLPIYDMCSMGFAPMSGEVLPYSESTFFARKEASPEKSLSPPLMDLSLASKEALDQATEAFWQGMLEDKKVSDELKAVLSRWEEAKPWDSYFDNSAPRVSKDCLATRDQLPEATRKGLDAESPD